jgi:predicted nucleic acid-binding protein
VTKRVYLETTISSYLAARPSRDLLQAARQQITSDWWNNQRQHYDLCISEIVLDEAAEGDADTARKRLSFLEELPLLDLTESVNEVAKAIMHSGLLPPKATRDSIHIGVAAVHGIDILLTWNCRHIANAAIMKELAAVVAACGFEMPILCTPEELLGD